jgi:hypothetical protein
MKEFRIISSIPGEKCCAYKAQVRCKFIFWTFWMGISDWRWSVSDCEKDIKFYKGEINNVVKEIS